MGSKLKKHKILIVDDSDVQRAVYRKRVLYPDDKNEYIFEILEAKNGEEAKRIIQQQNPDLVILDFNLPDTKGTDIIKWMQSNGFDDIQVILVSSIDSQEIAAQGLNLGAEDFVKIPYDPEEMRARVKAHLRLKRIIDHVRKARDRMFKLAQIDELTGIFNRRFLFEKLNELFEKYRREKKPLSILMLDIDNFKHINDTFGHQVGDNVLKTIGKILRNGVRKFDIVGRYGGEEFLIIAPGTSRERAIQLGNRLREKVKSHVFKTDKGDFSVTVSVGIAELLTDRPNDINDFVKIADMRLYRAKSAGKDCVIAE